MLYQPDETLSNNDNNHDEAFLIMVPKYEKLPSFSQPATPNPGSHQQHSALAHDADIPPFTRHCPEARLVDSLRALMWRTRRRVLRRGAGRVRGGRAGRAASKGRVVADERAPKGAPRPGGNRKEGTPHTDRPGRSRIRALSWVSGSEREQVESWGCAQWVRYGFGEDS